MTHFFITASVNPNAQNKSGSFISNTLKINKFQNKALQSENDYLPACKHGFYSKQVTTMHVNVLSNFFSNLPPPSRLVSHVYVNVLHPSPNREQPSAETANTLWPCWLALCLFPLQLVLCYNPP